MVRSGVPVELMVVGSCAVSLEVLVSPPPETVTVFVTEAVALAETLTVSVIGGKLVPADSTVVVLQVSVFRLHPQPDPVIAVAVNPAGNASTTVTVPLVALAPELAATIVYTAPVCPCVNEPVCDFEMVKSGGPPTGLIVVGSVPLSLEVLVSPPPETVTELLTEAPAFAATFTVSVMTGKLTPAASTVVVVQVSVFRLHPQPAPLIAVAVKPAGNASTRVTVPLVAPVPALVTVKL